MSQTPTMRVVPATTMPMINSLLRPFQFVRALQAEVEISRRHKREADVMIEELVGKLEEHEATIAGLRHSLEIAQTKRIAAEQIAVSRGTELEWLREQFQRVESQRESARHDQLQSLDLVNVALLKTAEAEAPPTKEQMAQWKPVPKLNRQSIPLMRKAQQAFIDGIRAKAKAANAPPATEKVQ